jgi:mannose-6-phosphate isomerase-like protein (cupin superfamily)
MPWICTPDFSGGCAPRVKSGPWFHPDFTGEPVPLTVKRRILGPGATDRVPLRGQENFAYVIAGAGTAAASPAVEGEEFRLGAESVLWLTSCDQMSAQAGPEGLDLLVAEATGLDPDVPPLPLRKVLAAAELPHLVSTRDTRDRLDLVTENVPVGARAIRADRISYHPGDTAAAHYHSDCHHVFCVLAGSGLIYTDGAANRLTAPDCALVGPGEVHWFENDTAGNFSFVEFWAPPPTQTIWTVTGDRCTWAPAG